MSRLFKNSKKAARVITLILILALMAVLMAGLTGCRNRHENEVRVFCYGDYFDPDLVEQFEEETGLSVIVDYYDVAEEMYPVIKNQAGVYDVICTSDYMIERMGNEGMLAEINFDNIPNYKHLGQEYKDIADKYYDPGNKYSVAYQFGIAGIIYNTKRIDDGEITGWSDLWKDKYSGKVIMLDGLRDLLGISLKKNGFSLNTMNEEELDIAVKDLVKQKKHVYKYATDSVRDFMVGESADVAAIWNGEVLYSQELNENLDFVIPEEGTELFFDCWVIPKNAYNQEAAEKWIDFMCRPDIALINFDYLTYSMPNETARKQLDEEYKNSPYLWLSEKQLKNCEVLRDLGPAGDDLYSKYWKIYKSSN